MKSADVGRAAVAWLIRGSTESVSEFYSASTQVRYCKFTCKKAPARTFGVPFFQQGGAGHVSACPAANAKLLFASDRLAGGAGLSSARCDHVRASHVTVTYFILPAKIAGLAADGIRAGAGPGSAKRGLAMMAARLFTSAMLTMTFGLGVAPAGADAADLVIAMPNWPSGQATANILKVAIKQEFGLDAEVKEMGALTAFAGMQSGKVAIHPEVWRPNYDEIIKKFVTEKKAVVLTGHSVAAWQGLCATPAAANTVGIKSVADLSDPEKTKALDTDGDGKGELWIGADTWLSTGIERVRANSYGYANDLTLVEAEEDVAMAAVDAAVATDQPMVFYCYAPHHLFKLHDITRLTEPPHDAAKWKLVSPGDPMWVSKSTASTAWPPSQFHIAYSTQFAGQHPDIAKFLEKVDLTTDEVTAMSYALQVERQAPFDYATKWVKARKTRVDGWAKP
jgi:glycine betaine/proline transport system substrate-binding protein